MYVYFTPPDRRFRLLCIAPELLLQALFNPTREEVVVEGLPQGCQVSAVAWNWERRCFSFRLWHPSFDPVDPCASIPEIVVTVRRVTEPNLLRERPRLFAHQPSAQLAGDVHEVTVTPTVVLDDSEADLQLPSH